MSFSQIKVRSRNIVARNKRHFRFLNNVTPLTRNLSAKLPISGLAQPFGLERRPTSYVCLAEYFATNPEAGYQKGVYPPKRTERKLPEIYNSDCVPIQYQELQEGNIPAATVTTLYNARYWGYYAGTIITPDNRLIEEFSREIWEMPLHRAFSVLGLPRLRHIKGRVAILSTAEANKNYWHWTLDLLPKFHLLEKGGGAPKDIDFYVINSTSLPFQEETLRDLGIPKEKVIISTKEVHVAADEMVIATFKKSSFDIPDWSLRFLRSLGQESDKENTGKRRRIYLSRRTSAFRRVTNENAVLELLAPLGFEMQTLDGMSVQQQRELFQEAEAVVGPHGAAFANMAYCNQGTLLLEFISPFYIYPCYWAMADSVPLRYAFLIGEGEVPPANANSRSIAADITVNLSDLESLLRRLL